jgi:Spy/CpxP family protein refolding chaperone
MNASLSSLSSVRRFLTVSALGLGLCGAFGCGASADPSEASAATPAAAAPAPAAQAEHGPGGFVMKAVQSLNLPADQQQKVDAIRATLQAQAAPVRTARAALGTELASEIRAGQIDHARLQPLADQVRAAGATMHPAMQTAMQQIHDLLDPSQRQALAATFRDRAENAPSGEGHQGKWRGHWKKMAADLNLTDAQRSTIHEAMHSAFAEKRAAAAPAEHGQRLAHLENLADAFEADTFDATVLGAPPQANAMAGHFARMGTFLDAAVPVLTPAQREILASKIQAHTQASAPIAE